MNDRREHVDVVFTGGTVRTADRARPVAEAVAVAGGRIAAVGTAHEIDALRTDATRVVDLAGRALYPGFVDVHTHHAAAGTTDLYELSFGTALGLDDILALVRQRAATLPAGAWVSGGSWASTLLGELDSAAARARLDEAAGGHPVVLTDDSRHNRWASSRALELAGIGRDAIPAEGVTLLDADGEPTGVLLEGAGIPVAHALRDAGGLTVAQHRRSSQRGIEMLNGFGITAFQDALASVDMLGALRSLDDAGELTAWVVTSLAIEEEIFGYDVVGDALLEVAESFRTAHHRPDFVKIFLDGIPPTRTAAFLEPYLPDDLHGAQFHGATTLTADELYGRLRAVASRGLGAKVHCTGDGSARMLVDAVERVRAEGFDRARFQIAHGQFLGDGDIERMARLGITADISPFLWFPGVIPDALAAVLGTARAARSQPNRSLIDAGALVAGGSDWPVSESPNPFEGMQGLVTRADPLGRAPGTLWPEQALTATEALEVFTVNAATAMGLGAETGAISAGLSADLVVVDRDFVAGPADDIIRTRVLETWFAGRRVFTARDDERARTRPPPPAQGDASPATGPARTREDVR